ncbi:META domain-containing protein [Saccharothrix longispora]|uniref:Heat shock protein HslJ n=1 Tax=Saccharothrix longispora TaxID=33920 RepID=A0ABU1PSQ0_9PSEU|nr:META domain-containing protein [Saccharothrix longispora]MDR6593678.1 heat shock protein HslJ [Saccharothrix longispora]
MRYTAFLMAVLLLTAACGRKVTPVGDSTPTGDDLRGLTFTASTGTEQGRPRALVAGTTVQVRFTDDGRLVVSGGCNTLSGPVDAGEGRLTVTDPSVTEMACDPERTGQDEFLVDLFTGNPAWRLDGDTLVIGSPDDNLRLVQERAVPLAGAVWRVDTLIRDTTAGAAPAGVTATFVFTGSEVAITGLCNLTAAEYRTTDQKIVFIPGPVTRKACEPDVMALEEAVLAVLDGEVAYALDARTLTLSKGSRGLRLIAEPR